MAEYKYTRREYMPQNVVETHVNEWRESGFADGYGDHVIKRSVVVCNPNDGCVIQRQTVIEQVSGPVMTKYGTSPPAIEVPMKVYRDHDYGGSYPANGGQLKVYRDHDYGVDKPVSPHHYKHPKTDEFTSVTQTDTGRPKTGSMSIMNWRQAPNSNGHEHSGSIDNWRDGSNPNIYGGHSDTAAGNGFHPHFEGYHGKNAMERDTKPKSTNTIEVGYTKPINYKGSAVDNWNEARNSPSFITPPIRSVTEKQKQGRFTVLTPSVVHHELFPSTIDSREAARKYGGRSISPHAIREAETYTPTIDSNEAASRYKGQIL